MKIIVPSYYKEFKCKADKCRHTCCQGWEIDIDEDRLSDYMNNPETAKHIDYGDTPHFRLDSEEKCPFLNKENLCSLILEYGEDYLCQICRDHPRFRNFWSDRTEVGLGLVCEEAARLILSRKEPMKLVTLYDDGENITLDEEEAWLRSFRDDLLRGVKETGPLARLLEYLIYRHIPDAMFDGIIEDRITFINQAYKEISAKWNETDKSLDSLIEILRLWSYDVEYDEEELEKRMSEISHAANIY